MSACSPPKPSRPQNPTPHSDGEGGSFGSACWTFGARERSCKSLCRTMASAVLDVVVSQSYRTCIQLLTLYGHIALLTFPAHAVMAMRRRKGSVPLFCAIAAAACFSLPQTDFTLVPEAGEFQELCVCLVVLALSAEGIRPQWQSESRWRRPFHRTQLGRFDCIVVD